MSTPLRHLILILGDQLDADALALADFDPAQDALWMAEVAEESTHIPSSKQRTALFLSAMRHFAADQRALGRTVLYTKLDDADNSGTLAGELARSLATQRPQKLVLTAPGDWRVLKALQAVAREHDLPLDLKDDTHFITTVREFAAHAKGRKQLRLEYFYREVRRKTGLLMEGKDPNKPIGGQWNFDADNRGAFPASGPEKVPPPLAAFVETYRPWIGFALICSFGIWVVAIFASGSDWIKGLWLKRARQKRIAERLENLPPSY